MNKAGRESIFVKQVRKARLRFGLAGVLLSAAIQATAQQDAETQLPEPPAAEAAPIAMLYDMNSRQTLFSREVDRRFAPASITKVMTTFVAFGKMQEGELDPRQRFSVRPETFKKWNRVGSTMFLAHDDKPTVNQLLHGITTVSANDGSVVLAEGAAGSLPKWLNEMNAAAQRIGMEDSHFGSPNGFPDEGRTFTTAHDLVTLGTRLIRDYPHHYQRYYGKRQMRYGGITQNNHDPITGRLFGADGIKTGFTNQAGYGFLGSAMRNGRRLVMVVAGSDRGWVRNEAARDLIEWGFTNFDVRRLFARGETVTTIPVQNGSLRDLPLIAEDGVAVSVLKDWNAEPEMTLRFEGPAVAPIKAGEPVAELVITSTGTGDARIPLVAAQDVAEANVAQRIRNGFLSWVD